MEDQLTDKIGPDSDDFDLGQRYAVIRFEGSEALEFLQRQLSNDVAALNPEIAQVNACLTPKGRVIGLLTLIMFDDAVLALVDRLLAATVGAHLQRYVIRADVRIIAPDPEWQIMGRFAAPGTQPAPPLDALPMTRESSTLILQWPGNRQIILSGEDRRQTNHGGSGQASLQRWDRTDIEHLLARIGPAESEQFVPQMLSLDSLNIVNFKKGCYPGQEVVARTHYRGRIKRHLATFTSNARLEPGTTLSIQDHDQLKPVGLSLQCIAADQGNWLGLAVVHESGITAKNLVSAADPSIDVNINPAPL